MINFPIETSYERNHFIIKLAKDVQFIKTIESSNNHNNTFLPVFIHEYWHFLQNVSTISGYKSFATSCHMLEVFSQSLISNKNGFSTGNQELLPEDKEYIDALWSIRRALEGDSTHRDIDFKCTKIVITDIEKNCRPVELDGIPIDNSFFTLKLSLHGDAGKKSIDFINLGNQAIEESIAFIICKVLVEQVPGMLPDPNDADMAPYRLLEILYEHFVGPIESYDDYLILCRLGTLALLTPYPGFYLINILEEYSGSKLRLMCKSLALKRIISHFLPDIFNGLRILQINDIPKLIDKFKGRGLAEDAVKYICSLFQLSFKKRMKNLFFDLDSYFSGISGFDNLINSIPPCPILQEREGLFEALNKDEIILVGDRKDETVCAGEYISHYLNVFAAQQDYLKRHLDYASRGFVDSGSAATGPCPFYTACVAPWRKSNPDNCRLTPWKNCSLITDTACVYSSAVISTYSIVKQGIISCG